MKTFAYTAYAPDGRRKRGVVVAEDETDASTRVAALGLMPATLTPQTSPGRTRRRERRINRDLLSVFTRQLAVLLGAGLTAESALEAVQASAGASRIERLAAEARAGLMQGEALADALTRAGGALPPWYAAAVRRDLLPDGPILDLRVQVTREIARRRAALAPVAAPGDPLDLLRIAAPVLAGGAQVNRIALVANGLRADVLIGDFRALDALVAALAQSGIDARVDGSGIEEGSVAATLLLQAVP